MTNLQEATWQTMDDVLQGKNVDGHLVAPILFKDSQPTLEDMQDFDKVLVFLTGKTKGGFSNIRQTEVLLTEENNYKETHSAGLLDGAFTTTHIDSTRIQYSLGAGGITITKVAALTTPGTYHTTFALVGEDWAEVFHVTIIVTTPLSVQYGTTTARHGETLTVTLTAPNFSSQYLYVKGSRSWVLTGVDTGKISVSPTSGAGVINPTDSRTVTISKAPALIVNAMTTTTFRISTNTHWVDVIVNLLPPPPPLEGRFVDPREGEEGATGTEDIYLYI